MIETLFALLVAIAVIAVAIYLSKIALDNLPVDSTLRGVIMAIIAFILLVVFLRHFGFI